MSSAREVVARALHELADEIPPPLVTEEAGVILSALGIPADMDVDEVRRRMAAVEAAPENKKAIFGCHCDLSACEPKDAMPDGCVIDEGRHQDCIYAHGREQRETCGYWLPITRESVEAHGGTWNPDKLKEREAPNGQ